ncbi:MULTISPECIES: D-amino-acid transaminase [Rhodomicrobium]|uniref:D-amino-acid transaminase n=1 Tax=Rhodomicrobium TaxID=1068 RepID=UPI000B4B0C2A|nr:MULTISPECIES: D-amino-acid transaminase [Rhodomicrobium]
MARVVYVNGSYSSYGEACVHVEDRGFQFADGVYEVCEVKAGRLIDERRHIDRLHRSLSELRMKVPMGRAALGIVLRETVRRNRVRDGMVYLQVTRGVAKRDFAFPSDDTAPTLVCLARSGSPAAAEKRASAGIKVITTPDIRWRRPDIKTVGLLPQALARQAAYDAGAKEAWLVDDNGFVTEGASCNAWIITPENAIITRPAETGILRGITRTVVVDLLGKEGFELIERAFSVEEAKAAREAFNTSATGIVTPVIAIDGTPVGDGKPGPLALRLRQHFHNFAEQSPLRALLR